MRIILWITTSILVLHAAQSYILLTANLDDVQALMKQLSQSPVANQLKNIWRRASKQFHTQVGRARADGMKKRADDPDSDVGDQEPENKPARKRSKGNKHIEIHMKRRQAEAEESTRRDTSFYLPSVQRVMDSM